MRSRSERRGTPPTPPPRDPSGINNFAQQQRRSSNSSFLAEEDMSSDSSSPPRAAPDHKRRSSYENVDHGFYPNKPPPSLSATPRRSSQSTPSPRPHVRSSPCPSSSCGGGSRRASPVGGTVRHPPDSWSDALSDEATGESVRRRPASACRANRSHRGSMPIVDCMGPGWGHRNTCAPCCGPSPLPYHWCGAAPSYAHFSMHSGNDPIYDCEDLQQRICQLEAEKEQLLLQVNVLTEQVEAQSEKIMELENSLSQSKEQLNCTEKQLRQEMSLRSAMESSKLDLMSQISALRLCLATVEQEKKEIEERNNKLENELILTCARLAEKEADLATFKSKLTRNGAVSPVFEYNPEVEKLKIAVTSLTVVNDQKEKKIQEMKVSLNRYKKLQELILSSPVRRATDGVSTKVPFGEENFLSPLDSIASCDLEDITEFPFEYNLAEKPPPAPRLFQPNFSSFSQNDDVQRSSSRLLEISRQSPLFSPIRGESPNPYSSLNNHKYGSSENVSPPTPQKTPPSKRHYSTLPRPHQEEILQKYINSPKGSPSPAGMTSGLTSQSFHNLHHPSFEAYRPTRNKVSSGMSFGKGFFKIRLGKRSSSAPELAPERSEEIPESPNSIQSNCRRTSSPMNTLPFKEKPKGFRRIFGKVRRTGSENLNSSDAEFKRGGIRATAGPRLGWSEEVKSKHGSFKVHKPFAEWDSALICDWLLGIGLGMYVSECRKWVKHGDQLLKATAHDLEKELGIKNHLHRKKLLLAISGAKEQTGDTVEPAGKLDHQWVVRWLDDIGLPQYKDAFHDARIDGRMLHRLTLEDLSILKVTNLLHHISIKTGIQVLRENSFDPHCLQRRSIADEVNTPSTVSRWTNHRVMEWLRTVDLSEYAPNLRGSGVHGGLMLYECRFNADLMATLLNIPPNKTLLRRHLTTQFKQLVGADIMQKKREYEAQTNYSPLSPNAKVKAVKRSHFPLKRKNKHETDFEDYLCPMNSSNEIFSRAQLSNGSQNHSEEEKFLMKEIGFKNEKILDSMPASNV